MLDLSAPAMNQLKGDDAKNLVAFYMSSQGIKKTYEWAADAEVEVNVAPTQPSVLRASAPTPGGGIGAQPRRTLSETIGQQEEDK